MADYYDKILLAIVATIAAGWFLGAATPVPMEHARTASFLAATPFVWHALFENPPLPPDAARQAAAAEVWHALLVWTLLDAFR